MAALRVPELDWELALYRLWAWLRDRLSPPAPRYDPVRVARLDDQPSLRVLAQLVAAEPVRLMPAREEGGLRGADLLVPVAIDLLADPAANAELLRLRVLLAAAMRRLARERGLRALDGEVAAAVQGCELAAAAAEVLCAELPGVRPAWERLRAAFAGARPSEVDPAELEVEVARRRALGREDAPGLARGVRSPSVPLWGPLHVGDVEGGAPDAGASSGPRPTPTTEAEAPAVEGVRRVTISERELEDQVLQHTFEKVETAEAFNGTVRDLDGADDLDDHLQALQEVDLGSLIRGGDEAHSVLRADLGGGEVPDVEDVRPGEQGVPYDEWDVGRGAWRRGWCTVYPTPFTARDPAWASAAARRTAPVLAHVLRRVGVERTRRREVGRRLDGDDLDLDAWIERHAESRVRRTDTGRVWSRRERLLREVSATLLLDASLSADAWIADRRTLDVTRDAAFVLGELASFLGDPLQVLAFASSTRHRCRVWSLKAFHEPWSVARGRLGAVVPQGYTRIGAALRHAIATAAARPEPQRLVILLTDGRPTDLDRYEGRYGVADVRMALRQAAADGVGVQALAVDPGARDTLPAMFGPGAWQVVSRPDELAPALVRAWEAARRVR